MDRIFIILFLLLGSYSSHAADGNGKTRTTLEQLIEERDKMIQSLLKRVEALENKESSKKGPVLTTTSPGTQASAPADAQTTDASQTTVRKKPKMTRASPPTQTAAVDTTEEEAQRALERTLVISGALLVPYGQAEAQPGFNYMRYSTQGSAFLQQGNAVSLATTTSHTNAYLGSVFLRLGLPWESQLEAYVPYESLNRTDTVLLNSGVYQNTIRNASNFGDIHLGLAKTLLNEKEWWPDVIARVTWSADNGPTPYLIPIGAGYNELIGSITVSKRQDPLVFYGTASYQAAFTQDNRSPGNTLGFVIGTILGASPDTSIRFFLNQNFLSNAEAYGKSIQGTATNISTLNIGASSVLGKGFFLDFTSGVGLTRTSPDYTVGLSFAYRFDLPFLPTF